MASQAVSALVFTDSLALHQFARQAALAEAGAGPRVVRHGALGTARDMTAAADSARAVVALAQRGAAGEAYNVGSGRATGMGELLALVLRAARVPLAAEEEPSRRRPYDERVMTADIGRLQALTGWAPATNLSQTVAEVMDYWRARVRQLYPGASAEEL